MYAAKETYIHSQDCHERAPQCPQQKRLGTQQKRPMYAAKETYVHSKRDLCTQQKRLMFTAKERDLHTPSSESSSSMSAGISISAPAALLVRRMLAMDRFFCCCMYVCMYACMYVCMYVCIHTHMRGRLLLRYAYACVCIADVHVSARKRITDVCII